MNEEFAIALKTVLDQSSIALVKQQLAELQNYMGQQMEEATAAATNAKGSIDVESFEIAVEHAKEIELILNKIGDLETTLSAADVLGLSSREILELEAEIEKLKNKIASLSKGSGGSSFSVVNETTVKITRNLKNAVSQVLKLGGALLGISTIYGSIRKAMSTYLSQNEELQAKLNGAWYALGSMFAPILERIVNWFIYLVSLVDALVKSLGFAGANMAKYGKAGAKASKQVAGFDEINNLNSQSGGGAAGGAAKLNEISEEALNRFKSILALVGAIAAGLAAWKVASILNDIFGWGLDPSRLAGIGLAVGGIVLAIGGLLNYLNDPSWLNFGEIIGGIGLAIAGVGLAIGSVPLQIAGAIVAVLGLLAAFWPQVSAFLDKVVEAVNNCLDWVHKNITTNFGIFGLLLGTFIEGVLGAIRDLINTAKEFLDDLFNGVKKIIDGIIQVFRGDLAGGISTILQGIAQMVRGILNTVRNLVETGFNAVKTLVGNLFSWVSDKTSTSVKNIINRFIVDPINRVIGWINSALNFSYGGLNILGKQVIAPFSLNLGNLKNIPSLSVGTNFVPNDTLAQLHQGEAVIPKAFNEDQYNNSEETNELLRELINVVDSKDFRTYISQREVGKAAVNYINSQSRIMGGSIV